MGKQQVSSRQIPNLGHKKSIFEQGKFPQPVQNVTATPVTTDLSEYPQPQPGEMIANVMGSLSNFKSSSPPDYLTGKQLPSLKRQSREGNIAPVNQLKAPPRLSLPTGGVVQTKLTIGNPNDRYEQEADRVAAKVVQQINRPAPVSMAQGGVVQGKEEGLGMKPMPAITQQEAMAEEGELQMKPMVQRREAIGGGEASTDLESSINRAKGGGQPLDTGLQRSMGGAMKADFSGVRVHTDSSADELNISIQAKAFTTGQDLFFKKGEYQPGSRDGQELIAHELTHVLQQKGDVIQRYSDEDKGYTPPSSIDEEEEHAPPSIDEEEEHAPAKEIMDAMIDVALKKLRKYDQRNKTKIEKELKNYQANPTPEGLELYLCEVCKIIGKELDNQKKENERTLLKQAYDCIENARDMIDLLLYKSGDIDTDRYYKTLGAIDTDRYYKTVGAKDIGGQQFRITGKAPNRKVELVEFRENSGSYWVTGELLGLLGKKQLNIREYEEYEQIELEGWQPKITYLNGMNIKPTTGVRDALSLHEAVNQRMEKVGANAFSENDIDLLWTYSEKLVDGIDALSCAKGKMRLGSDEITIQKELMVRAVKQENRVVMVAHSRGTIKTDNAVVKAYKELSREFQKDGIPVEELLILMDRYIKLIYAGNAVHPSNLLPVELIANYDDKVSKMWGVHPSGHRGIAQDVVPQNRKSRLKFAGYRLRFRKRKYHRNTRLHHGDGGARGYRGIRHGGLSGSEHSLEQYNQKISELFVEDYQSHR